MELTKAEWSLIKFLVAEKRFEYLPNVFDALESGLHFVGVKKSGKEIEFSFE